MKRFLIIKGTDARDVDGVIAAQDNGQGASGQCLANTKLNVGVAFFRVRVNNVCVTHVDDCNIFTQINGIVLMVVCARMTK